MARPPVISFRFSRDLVERIDRYAAQLEQEAGVPVSRNAAAAKLLAAALDAIEAAHEEPARAPGRGFQTPRGGWRAPKAEKKK